MFKIKLTKKIVPIYGKNSLSVGKGDMIIGTTYQPFIIDFLLHGPESGATPDKPAIVGRYLTNMNAGVEFWGEGDYTVINSSIKL